MARTRRKDAKRAELQQGEEQASGSYNRFLRILLVQLFVVGVGMTLQHFYLPDTVPGALGGGASGSEPPCGLNKGTREDGKGRLAIFSERVVTPEGVFPATVRIEGRAITEVVRGRAPPAEGSGVAFVDYGSLVVSPGVVDLHVHVNEPGRTEWEGFRTATAAAAAGGVTSFFDMPLNSKPAATTAAILRNKIEVARDKLHVDVGFWGGLVPENAEGSRKELRALLGAGAAGLKAFMAPSGIADFGHCNATCLEAGLRELSRRGGTKKPLMVHAELPFDPEFDTSARDARKYETYMHTRPGEFETKAIRLLMSVSEKLARERVAHRVHIAHVAYAPILKEIQRYKNRAAVMQRDTVAFTAETCPHYLVFEAESVPDGAVQYKCAPPIRGRANRQGLREHLREGAIDSVGSDHSPAPPDVKFLEEGDFLRAWGGISGLQYTLPATWAAARAVGATLEDMAAWLSAAPAAIAGLGDRGAIEAGKKADLVVWDDGAPAETSQQACRHRHKLSPYNDMDLMGKVEATFVSGHLVFSEGQVSGDTCGKVILG